MHTLDLSYCSEITDVSALGNVHTLKLNGCNKIIDFSALINVYSLEVERCNRDIVDVLKNVNIDEYVWYGSNRIKQKNTFPWGRPVLRST